jgi:hypothetical protein
MLPAGGLPALSRLAMALPIACLVVAVVVLTLYCESLLADATSGRAVVAGDLPLVLAAGGFLAAAAAVVVLQASRVASRVAGPEYRLRVALQRIRGGDIGFRVHLRRGDLLTGLAHECNELLDWLNANPPAGVATGSDVVDVEAEPVDDASSCGDEAPDLEEIAR